MNDLDHLVRDALHREVAPMRTDADDLAAALAARGPDPRLARSGGRSRWRGSAARPLAAAAVAVLLLVVAVAIAAIADVADRPEPDGRVRTQPRPTEPTPSEPEGFAALGPGWHRLDAGPAAALGETDDRGLGAIAIGPGGLALVATTPAGDGVVWLRAPDGTWQTLPSTGLRFTEGADAVWADDRLVVIARVFGGASEAARWDPDSRAWVDLGTATRSPELESTGARPATGAPVWTGERLIDLVEGAALDVDTGTWTVLPFPGDLATYSALLSTNPVWDGREVVFVPFASRPGLAWSADGTDVRVVPAMPDALAEATGTAGSVELARAVRFGDLVVLLAAGPGGPVVSYDARTDRWTQLPGASSADNEERYPGAMVSIGDRLLLDGGCEGAPTQTFDGTAWTDVARPAHHRPCAGTYLVAGEGAVVRVEASNDTINDSDAPYLALSVWVPPT